MTNENLPVEEVGGHQDTGPWPEHAEEVVAGEEYTREVQTSEGVKERTVTVTYSEKDEDGARVVAHHSGGSA